MSSLSLQPTSQAQWHALIEDAVVASGVVVDEELKSYLIMLLTRFSADPALFSRALALDYLQSMDERGALRRDHLRDIGDKCLLFSGFFPGRSQRQRVSIHYYVDLGRSAYGLLGDLANSEFNRLYAALCHEFILLMDVLLATRTLHGAPSALTPLQAQALWSATGSQQALQVLQRASQGMSLKTTDWGEYLH